MKRKVKTRAKAALMILSVVFASVLAMLDIGQWKRLDMGAVTGAAATSYIYSSEGEELAGLYSGENREYAKLSDMSPYLPKAFVAAEDARFYEHAGVDPRRIAGALWADIRSLSLSEGASTITQQLVRMTMLTNDKTFSRKAQEAWLALLLETRLSKDEILELYMNTAYFGDAAYGAEAAARTYFSKSAKDLTLSECALLAGLVKAPSSYQPDKAPEKALARREYVLSRMAECGYITEEESAAANAEELRLRPREKAATEYGWYADAAMKEAMEILDISAEAFLTGGYRVYTPLRVPLQKAADALFRESGRFPANAADGTPAQSALIAIDPETGGVLSVVGGRKYETRRGLNRATDITRQPGSAFKPVSVYVAAIDGAGYLPTSLIEDEKRDFGGGYSPRNAGGSYYGTVTVRTALSKSLNAASVDLLTRVGVGSAREYAARLGLPLSREDAGLSLALGALTRGVSPAELCAAYAAFANGGRAVAPRFIERIENRNGEVLYAAENAGEPVIRPESASLITSMLESAAASGSAKALSGAGYPVAGKTGTVSMASGSAAGNRDAWIAAYTPNIAVCVWMGFDEPDDAHCLPASCGGSAEPTRLAAAFLSSVSDYANGGAFPIASGLESAQIDLKALEETNAVMLASEYTPPSKRLTELFYANRAPEAISNVWRAPRMVWDLSVGREDGYPALRFTAEQGAGYHIYRETQGEETLVAECVSSVSGEVYVLDTQADPFVPHSYAVAPFHAELREEGILLEGPKCAQVSWRPSGALSGLWDGIFGGAGGNPSEPDAGESPLF